MAELFIFLLGLSVGLSVGAWGIWQLWLKHERPIIRADLVLDPAVLHQINAKMTLAWLENQGLTWTAKGVDFDFNRVKK